MRINEEGKLVGRHLDFFGSTDLLRSSMGMHIPNASSLEDIRISDAPETEVGVDFCLTWNIDPRWVFIGYEKKSPKNPHLEFNRKQTRKTLPKALRTQVLTALTSNFGLVGLIQYAW